MALTLVFNASGDSLFSEKTEKEGTLISDKAATFEKGDIISVLVQETLSAQTQSNLQARKEADVSAEAGVAENSTLVANKPTGMGIFSPGELPNWEIEVENETRARGQTDRRNTLTATVACTVVAVHENGNVELEGSKQVQVNRENTLLVLKGTIRARDVTPANTVISTQMANGTIVLRGQGPLWNNQRRGLFTKLLDWISPF
jgi:flagellar L-ring protein precursor FlgH